MNIRPFDWRDLPTLRRFRQQSVYLHSSLVLTRGPILLSGALLSTLAPGIGLVTSVSAAEDDSSHIIIGQTMHSAGSQCAQLTFLTPESSLDANGLNPLLEDFSAQAGERGAFRLLADVDEGTTTFDALRQSGFAIYARQRIWRLAGQPAGEPKPMSWRTAEQKDLIPVRSLYNNLIPGLVQQIEPFPNERLRGLVYHEEDELLGYVELKYGHRGIWAQPFIHPDAEAVAEHLVDLFQHLPQRHSRPVYVCVRSYQSWLEPVIEGMGAESSPRQAMMVKHLAVPQKALRAYSLPALEGGQPEITTSITRSNSQVNENTREKHDLYVAKTNNG
jgi:hypothetical protein